MICAFLFLFFMASACGYQTTSLVIDEECLNFTVYPVQYELRIKPSIYTTENFFYDCDLVITVIANAPQVKIIELDAEKLEITSVKVYRQQTNIINRNTPFKYDRFYGKLYIYLSEPLREYKSSRMQYHIHIVFKKLVRYDTLGVFAVKYDSAEGAKYMILTRLSRNHAKYFFPCFDNNRFEAVFKFKVNMISGDHGMQYTNSSLVIAEEQRRVIQNNDAFIEYLPSPQVSLNEIGFVYSQFSNVSIRARNTNDTIIIWAPPPSLLYYNYILKFGQTIMDLIHEYAQIDRVITYGPINVVAVPSYLDGYEIGSWNLWTNGDHRLLYVPELTSIRQVENMTFDFAQQLCRVWLGNPGEHPRTNWKEEWFKEGVATYFAYYFLGKYHIITGQSIKSRLPYGFYGLQMRHKAMLVDWHHSTPALVNFNRTLAVEIPSRNKELVTMKTAALLWMVENWIGTEKFHAAMVKYINMRRGSYISIEDFMVNLDKETVECFNQFFNGSTSSRVLDSWVNQPGYPVITVQVFRDRSPNVILLKQRKFTFTTDLRHDSKYLIPISYVVQHDQNCLNCHQPRFTMSTPSYSFGENLNGGWIILNRRASGYYRVNYDVDSWKLIAMTLQENHKSIEELNRAQIVNDVFALYAAGDLRHELAIEILSYLEKEQSFAVWEAAITGFELLKIEGAACNFTKALYEEWQQFMRKSVRNIYETLIVDLDQEPQTRLFRSNIITFACAARLAPCLRRLRAARAQAAGAAGGLDPDSRQACYYMVMSENQESSTTFQNLTRFEEEDRRIAIRRTREKSRLMYRLPPGSKMVSNLVLNDSTTYPTSKPTASASHNPVPDSGVAVRTSIASLLLAYLFLIIF